MWLGVKDTQDQARLSAIFIDCVRHPSHIPQNGDRLGFINSKDWLGRCSAEASILRDPPSLFGSRPGTHMLGFSDVVPESLPLLSTWSVLGEPSRVKTNNLESDRV